MTLRLIVDHRENAVKQILQEPYIEYQMLEHGDFAFEYNGEMKLIIERKTIPDLCASIKDMRYKNQKQSLLSTYPKEAICYVIEGDIQYCKQSGTVGGISIDAIQSCIINTMLRDGIKVFNTKNVTDTCDLIKQIYNRFSKDPDKYFVALPLTETAVVKEKGITPESCYIAQLCQIPGISKKTAEAIAEKHPCMSALFKALSGNSKTAFDGIKTECKGRQRNISSACVHNIMEFMK
jgi:ERCC4-type nuclease